MLYTPLTKEALKIAFMAHKDQKDKGGLPYIYHPYHLAELMDTEDEVVVALLHEFPGIGGVGNLIGPQINDYFFGGLKPTNWMSFAYDAISNNKDDYILLMKNFWEYELAKCRASGDEALLEFVKRSYASSKRASEYFPKLIVVKYW